jgi:hypothetical protein
VYTSLRDREREKQRERERETERLRDIERKGGPDAETIGLGGG